SISFVHLPRPPSPTLFPYTTLFRSSSRSSRSSSSATTKGSCVDPSRHHGPARLWQGHAGSSARRGLRRPRDLDRRHLPRQHQGRDRKSTRLNSSHVKISYAVFCLKK